jgi:hypothetical protein
MDSISPRYVRIPELAPIFRCSRAKAYLLVKQLGIKTVNIAGLNLVPLEEVERVSREANAAAGIGSDDNR